MPDADAPKKGITEDESKKHITAAVTKKAVFEVFFVVLSAYFFIAHRLIN